MNDSARPTAPGRLFIVSVGIGDPDNITLRAQRTIAAADVVFCMSFVGAQFPDLLAGKTVHDAGHLLFTRIPATPPMTFPVDEESEARTRTTLRGAIGAGKTVAVLDYGDPTLFSPQSGYLAEFADLDPIIVPGVSSINAGNAALRREISGNYDHPVLISDALGTNPATGERIDRAVASGATLIFLTMGADLPFLVDRLGRTLPANTPVALVVNAGFNETERVIDSTLKHLLERDCPPELPWQYLLYVGRALRQGDGVSCSACCGGCHH